MVSAPNQAKPVSRERIGRYEVIRKIATGGMAELFLAKQVGMEGFERVVAIKRILAHLAFDEEFINMFRDEARIVAKLSHPNIVQIFDLGKAEDSYFIAMEYIPGRNLATVAKRVKQLGERIPPLYLARCLAQACEGLHYAHTREDLDGAALGIVHRDVSPQNIIVAFSGGVKLVDFGIAKAATKIAHTRAGVLKGKYAYMSPEQIRGETIDARSDLFSAGIVLFELLTGQRPFEKDSSIQTLKAIVHDPHPDCRRLNPEIPEALARIIDRALEKQRERRYQSAQELQLALEDAVASAEDRVNSLSIANWMKRLFEAELAKSSGNTMVVKGVGEVILPPPDDSVVGAVAADAAHGFSEEGTEESAARAAPVELSAAPRSTTGAGRKHLIEEGVIAHPLSHPPDAPGVDPATELASEAVAAAPAARLFDETDHSASPADPTSPSFAAGDEATFESREALSALSEPAARAPSAPPDPSLRSSFSDVADSLLELSDDDADPWGDKTSADPQSELPPPLLDTLAQPAIQVMEAAPREAVVAEPEVALGAGLELEPEADDPWGDRTAAEPGPAEAPSDELPVYDPSDQDATLPPSQGIPAEALRSRRAPEPIALEPEAPVELSDALSLAFSDEPETVSGGARPVRAPAPVVDTLDTLDPARELDDEPDLPEAARQNLGRDVEADSATVAGMGLLETGFPEDEATVGLSPAADDAAGAASLDGPSQRLAAIRLEKRGATLSGAMEERARPNSYIELEEPEAPRRVGLAFEPEPEPEERTAPAEPALGPARRAPEPRVASVTPPPTVRPSDPLMSAAFAELGSPAELFRPKEADPIVPLDEAHAALGSTRVPPGSLSLSDLLTDERRSAYGMGLASKPPPPISAGASAARSVPPVRAAGLRNIRETSRAGGGPPPAPPATNVAPPAAPYPGPAVGSPMMPGPMLPGSAPMPGPMMVLGPDGQPMAAPGGFVPQPAPYRPARGTNVLHWVLVVLGVLVLSALGGVAFYALQGTRLVIESAPPGARVSINGHPVEGRTPVEVRRLRPGASYQVKLEAEGYEDYLGVVVFPEKSRDARVQFKLEPNPAAVKSE